MLGVKVGGTGYRLDELMDIVESAR